MQTAFTVTMVVVSALAAGTLAVMLLHPRSRYHQLHRARRLAGTPRTGRDWPPATTTPADDATTVLPVISGDDAQLHLPAARVPGYVLATSSHRPGRHRVHTELDDDDADAFPVAHPDRDPGLRVTYAETTPDGHRHIHQGVPLDDLTRALHVVVPTVPPIAQRDLERQIPDVAQAHVLTSVRPSFPGPGGQPLRRLDPESVRHQLRRLDGNDVPTAAPIRAVERPDQWDPTSWAWPASADAPASSGGAQ